MPANRKLTADRRPYDGFATDAMMRCKYRPQRHFSSNYHDDGWTRGRTRKELSRLCCSAKYLALRQRRGLCYTAWWYDKNGACNVDLALRLDVLAMCAVFAFVGAILLGAF